MSAAIAQASAAAAANAKPALQSWLLGHSHPRTTVKPTRDVRVDVIRGLALMMIFINHMPGNAATAATLANFVFNDAAEVFVLLAGYSSMLAYSRGFGGGSLWSAARPILARALTLYKVQMALSALMLGLGLWLGRAMGSEIFVSHLEISDLMDAPLTALLAAPLLLFHLSYADILPMYVVLLVAAPLLIAAVRRSPILTLLGSVLVYATALSTGLNLPQVFGGEWFFNPFSWQLIFVVGLLAGHATLNGVRLPRSPALLGAAAAFVLFAVSQKAPWAAFGLAFDMTVALPVNLNYGSKTFVAPGRLISLLSIAYLTAVLLPRDAGWLSGSAARMLQSAGRHSLPVFAAGTVLSLLGMAAIAATGQNPAVMAAVTVAGVALMLALALRLEPRAQPIAYRQLS